MFIARSGVMTCRRLFCLHTTGREDLGAAGSLPKYSLYEAQRGASVEDDLGVLLALCREAEVTEVVA